jgi:hypothetical protein
VWLKSGLACFCRPWKTNGYNNGNLQLSPINTHLFFISYFTGGTFSKIFGMVWGRREYRILIVGLDGAGKTTILYRLQVHQNQILTDIQGYFLVR